MATTTVRVGQKQYSLNLPPFSASFAGHAMVRVRRGEKEERLEPDDARRRLAQLEHRIEKAQERVRYASGAPSVGMFAAFGSMARSVFPALQVAQLSRERDRLSRGLAEHSSRVSRARERYESVIAAMQSNSELIEWMPVEILGSCSHCHSALSDEALGRIESTGFGECAACTRKLRHFVNSPETHTAEVARAGLASGIVHAWNRVDPERRTQALMAYVQESMRQLRCDDDLPLADAQRRYPDVARLSYPYAIATASALLLGGPPAAADSRRFARMLIDAGVSRRRLGSWIVRIVARQDHTYDSRVREYAMELESARQERRRASLGRRTWCWRCKVPLTSERHDTCLECGWIMCSCGACGCPAHARPLGVLASHPGRQVDGRVFLAKMADASETAARRS